MGHESDLFRTYFSEITLLEGGSVNTDMIRISFNCLPLSLIIYRADSGFYRVKPEEYKPRLLHFHGVKVLVLLLY